jgi:thymidylate kinase
MQSVSIASSTSVSAPQSTRQPCSTGTRDVRGKLLESIAALLDAQNLPWCVLHGADEYPTRVISDVDCVMPAEVLPWRLAALLRDHRDVIGATLVQWIRHESTSHYFVLRVDEPCAPTAFLCLDISSDYRRNGRVFYPGGEILASRRREGGFWVPSPALEFGCYLVKKVAKRSLSEDHGRRLTALYARDPAGCEQQIARFWRGRHRSLIARAAASGEWQRAQKRLGSLRKELVRPGTLRELGTSVEYWAADIPRRFARWRESTGLHVVLLGPDGSGKSTTLAAVEKVLAPAFRRVRSRHLAPALLRRPRASASRTLPQNQRPRSPVGSLAKAAYWVIDYSVGYYLTVRPALARSTLTMFDRYLVDALVDPRRYRYGGPRWALALAWWLVPKPDLVILLDAPPDVVRARKQEVHPSETGRQCAAYRELVARLPGGRIVDAAQPLEQVVETVASAILDFMASRTRQRLAGQRASED